MEVRSTRKRWAAIGAASALALGAAGGATLASVASAQGVVDPGPSSTFESTVPVRVFDTRSGLGLPGGEPDPVGPGETVTLDLTDVLDPFTGTPNAVVLNVGVEGPSAQSYLAVLPGDTPPGQTSTINFSPGQTIANQATVTLGPGNQIDIFNAEGTVEVFIDLQGAFSAVV